MITQTPRARSERGRNGQYPMDHVQREEVYRERDGDKTRSQTASNKDNGKMYSAREQWTKPPSGTAREPRPTEEMQVRESETKALERERERERERRAGKEESEEEKERVRERREEERKRNLSS